MQKGAPYTPPPRQRQYNNANSAHERELSPALLMAKRIRAEQGAEAAEQFIASMGPYIAPGEQRMIAQQLNLSIPQPQQRQPIPQQEPSYQYDTQINGGNNMNGMNMGGPLGNMMNAFSAMNGMGGMNGRMNNPMQMLQMLQNFQGDKGGQGMMNPMLLAQLFGMLSKKN